MYEYEYERTAVKFLDVFGFALCALSLWTLYANQISFIA